MQLPCSSFLVIPLALALSSSVLIQAASAGPPQASVGGNFQDSSFLPSSWDLILLTSGNGGVATATQQVSGGNPDAFRRVAVSVNGAPSPLERSSVVTFHRYVGGSYSPSTQGGVAWIDYSEDGLMFSGSGEGQNSGPCIRQGGRVFILGSYLPTADVAWTSKQRQHLVASDFVWANMGQPDPVDYGVHPDFSASGGPMELGFFRALSTAAGGPASAVDAGIDNWSLSVVTIEGRRFCFGDVGAACPCGNSGAPENGCASSINGYGANLAAAGHAEVGADNFVLVATGMPDSSALFFQGTSALNGGSGAPFGDGLRCAGGAVMRLAPKVNVGGMSQYPEVGDLPVSVVGAVPMAGGTRTYQVWYRNAAPFCTIDTFNLTNAISVLWSRPSGPIEIVLPDADGEGFTNTSNQDISHSSAAWGAGKLTRGQGGGRGRLGDLLVRTGTTLVLSTTSQTFPLDLAGAHDVLTNQIPGIDYQPLVVTDWPTIAVTDGAFEFSNLIIESGGTLRFQGSQPARIFVRGNVNIQGLLDISGSAPAPHNSSSILGGQGGAAGPAAGVGAEGATRFDYGGTNMLAVGAVDVPNASVFVDGRRGRGVGGVDYIAAGFGGAHWPTATPLNMNIAPPNNLDLTFSNIAASCLSGQMGLPGGGGGYATDGLPGVPATPVPNSTDGIPNLPVIGSSGQGGPSSDVGLEPPGSLANIRRLRFEAGHLRGGSGGGGGGATAFGTESSGFGGQCLDSSSVVATWRDHSGAGGGGGGGAAQLVCGGPSLTVAGRIDAGGGDGGSSLAAYVGDDEEAELRSKRAVPGGGGSGGAIRLQAMNFPSSALSLAMPPRLDVSGGAGGTNTTGSVGGRGGAGLVRLEGLNSLPVASEIASLLAPNDPAVVGTDAINILSIGSWSVPRVRPETYSGGMSCWMRPPGTLSQVEYLGDDPLATDPNQRYGWSMDVIYGPSSTVYSYRDPTNSPFAPQSIEDVYPNVLDGPVPGSYLAVRFQGARSAGEVSDLCGVDLATQVVAGSLTPWVSHPDQLNLFSPRPNLIRFVVVFDFAATFNDPQAQVQGITNLKIRARVQ